MMSDFQSISTKIIFFQLKHTMESLNEALKLAHASVAQLENEVCDLRSRTTVLEAELEGAKSFGVEKMAENALLQQQLADLRSKSRTATL